MILEDHAGDVLRKARHAANVSLQTAAQTAGWSEQELASFEESGRSSQAMNLPALCVLLGLDAGKFERLMDGWLPSRADLSRWRELRSISTTQGDNTVNCHLVWDEVTREAALFDTGWEASPILRLIEDHGLQLTHLFLTHLHEDHIACMAALRERFPKLHLRTNSKTVPPQHRNRANDCLHLGSLRITNRETPGHAEEGVIYLVGNWPDDAPHVAFVGDTLFAGSLATGLQSWDLLKNSVRSQILSLPPDTLLCPGHGPLTTVAEEKANNPFFT